MNRRSRMRAWMGSAGVLFATVAAIPACAQPSDHGQKIGRLFFTPQQRQELDKRRVLNVPEAKTVVVKQGTVTVNGHISRSSGKTTTWVNGVPQHDAYRPRVPDTVPVAAADAGPTVPVRVGQTLDKANATVSDNLQGGSIRVERGSSQDR